MVQLSKPKKSIKLPSGKQKKVKSALELLSETYGDLLQNWCSLTEEQKQEVLAHSPCLNELKMLTEPLRG